ncbi:carotenoid 1,2-hydratase [Photobacterium sanctipauli]|uniref:Carotenoid 1,2-hydratase n=2 Tax=Photobacterium sanctipauli TaxID=1342794 RepID=A0A2T3NZ60_9GAMM|nr:carotenoid 1,2-hydratase [Photobacterium sanctipauli]
MATRKVSGHWLWRLKLIVVLLSALGLLGCEDSAQNDDRAIALMAAQVDEQFSQVEPGKILSFPRDHLSHPDFRTEWWYLTANLEAENGEVFGVQWTLFRSAASNSSGKGWESPQRFMSHTVITSAKQTWAAERFARGGIGQAGVRSRPFLAWLDNWQWRSYSDSPFPAVLTFADGDMKATLAVQKTGEHVLQGEQGYSKKHATENIASYYYSEPFLHVNGKLELNGETYKVKGKGWYDHEWSSVGLSELQQGWDWFSVHLDDGRALMLYQIREKNRQPYYFGSLSWPNGESLKLGEGDIRLVPVTFTTHKGRNYPLKWSIAIPSQDISIKVDVVRKEQWLPFVFSYWEGPIEVSGSHSGQGFMELTGY